jgi:hypothetical protein
MINPHDNIFNESLDSVICTCKIKFKNAQDIFIILGANISLVSKD